MSKAETVDEPSMDEILSSIRKIIAEDEVEQPFAAKRGPKVVGDVPGHPSLPLDDDETLTLTDDDEGADDIAAAAVGDEVLDLTADDADQPCDDATESPEPEPGAMAEPDDGPSVEDGFDDEPVVAATIEPEPSTAAADQPPAPPALAQELTEVLLDAGVSRVATASLHKLAAAVAPGEAMAGGQRTIEAFVADLLRPELKAWLDANLATLVERIVEREIKKLVRDAQGD